MIHALLTAVSLLSAAITGVLLVLLRRTWDALEELKGQGVSVSVRMERRRGRRSRGGSLMGHPMQIPIDPERLRKLAVG